MTNPDVEKLFTELGMDSADYAEPTLGEKLEASRLAIDIIRIIDRGSIKDFLSYWSSLGEHEQGHAIGALAQFAVVGVYAMAALGGRDFYEQLDVMAAELASVHKDGGSS